MTSDGEGNGPVRRIARGGGESALLEGGCVKEDEAEAEEPGGWPWNGMAVEKTSATDDKDRFKPGFYGQLRSPLSRPSFPCNGSQSDAACAGLSHGMKA